jgi:hypothetical protein
MCDVKQIKLISGGGDCGSRNANEAIMVRVVESGGVLSFAGVWSQGVTFVLVHVALVAEKIFLHLVF